MAPKKKARVEAALTEPSWEYLSDDGWTAFVPEDKKLLEDAYAARKTQLKTSALSFNHGFSTEYVFDFTAWTQYNSDSKKFRQIRRIAPLSEVQWEWQDDALLFVPFFDEDSLEIERMYQLLSIPPVADESGSKITVGSAKTKKLSWNKGYNSMYTFTFYRVGSSTGSPIVTGLQRNDDSQKSRELRRVEKKAPWSTEGYGLLGNTAAVAAAAAVDTPATTSTAVAATPVATPSGDDGPQLLTTKSTTLSIPQHWTVKSAHVFDASGFFGTAVVPTGSEEHKTISQLLLTTVGRTVSIVKILRVENATLWTFYAMTRSAIAGRYDGDANEQFMFYGERVAKNVQTIHKLGFDTRVAESGKFGMGLHFSTKATFCDTGKCVVNKDGSRDVLVCRVAVGQSVQGSLNIRRPPPKDPKKPTVNLYDSCCDDKKPPELHIIFNNAQAYPEYVITYQ